MSSSNYFRSWIDRPHLDPNTRLLTEEYQRGITEFMGLVHRQPEAKTAEDLAGVGLVVDLSDFAEEAVVHVEDEPVIGEFHQDPDSDSFGDDDSETD
ncbi:hypothetical protein DY000_02029874 [Brassica cretica]|uniref:DUF768 domain-containing protein n=1 Tax=Brassica cretica TaxID=69181 RepID=A0ABQ7DUG2_BRACR|nr:hypothetical protein DY000_02029874 [Brassica cretica]